MNIGYNSVRFRPVQPSLAGPDTGGCSLFLGHGAIEILFTDRFHFARGLIRPGRTLPLPAWSELPPVGFAPPPAWPGMAGHRQCRAGHPFDVSPFLEVHDSRKPSTRVRIGTSWVPRVVPTMSINNSTSLFSASATTTVRTGTAASAPASPWRSHAAVRQTSDSVKTKRKNPPVVSSLIVHRLCNCRSGASCTHRNRPG